MRKEPITTSSSWDLDTLEKFDDEISRIANNYLELDTYQNQIEVISSEQMVDLYSLTGLPLSYDHWKFGKQFVKDWQSYKKGRKGLAFEIVINSNPCISYNMEDNTTAMMAMVIAHAAYGHNAFFKNNYMFETWTDASFIIDYMKFAKNYVAKCEQKYGYKDVEITLDAAHALMNHGVHKYKKPTKKTSKEKERQRKKKIEHDRKNYDDVWSKTLKGVLDDEAEEDVDDEFNFDSLEEPEENILYFLEKNSPRLKQWQRELIRIVRKIAQYFYPQSQTKVANEGFATFTHYHIMNKLFEENVIGEGFQLEFLDHHTAVVNQPSFDSKYFNGLNPYALGFNILMDIKRMCQDPTEEDKEWFPNVAGGDWKEEVKFAAYNFRDDSLIHQYLSPKVIRDMKLFRIEDYDEEHYIVRNIHNKRGYKTIREKLSKRYNRINYVPNIQVYDVIQSKRELVLIYKDYKENELHDKNLAKTMKYLQFLWNGFPVKIIDEDHNTIHKISPMH